MKLSEQELKILKNFFREKPVLRVYLFGSYGRGDANEKSDIDLLVDLDYSKHIGLEFIGMKLDLEDLLLKNVDLVAHDGLSRHLAPTIEKEKRLIYERQNG
ncbi:MAG TPA: nucleotidyltransferase domain-containing protein [Bacteroidetes bacterium]|nr:nucleotidyltransferase domain-containing protein [Bacteroidota bacterium]